MARPFLDDSLKVLVPFSEVYLNRVGWGVFFFLSAFLSDEPLVQALRIVLKMHTLWEVASSDPPLYRSFYRSDFPSEAIELCFFRPDGALTREPLPAECTPFIFSPVFDFPCLADLLLGQASLKFLMEGARRAVHFFSCPSALSSLPGCP